MNSPRLAVIICSKGRPHILAETLASVMRQEVLPDEIILSVTSQDDLPADLSPEIRIVTGEAGLPRQLNRALDALDSAVEFILFLDDDVELDTAYLREGIRILQGEPGYAGIHGWVLRDEQTTREDARNLLSVQEETPVLRPHPCRRLYGCNMLVRRAALEGFRFDERLPLYGWLFEIPFSRHLRRYGLLVKSRACRLVHLREESARLGGNRFGYAQIANPLYLFRQGALGAGEMIFRYMLSALASNVIKALSGSPERLRGNLLALGEWSDGHIDPQRILKL
ncbi:glycosyltransferase [Oscillatoria amoena NRMC-F 0135]|nr:glycosyltransferase [Oscillatoria laete-virens]MDL5047217.1 glycosyltransferase [Oscillatoria amoena NRMC-F 0135]MDL5052554.1 glycosyltransferase [Oscillatoria laete-virens NRMC-F 0139]